MKQVIIKCPECGADINIEVPKNACVAVVKCNACGAQITTKPECCCVICCYSDKNCKDLMEE
jgi:hypothetical protein